MARLALRNHSQPPKDTRPCARIVDVEPRRGLDVVVVVERSSRRRALVWVRYTILDPVDGVLACGVVEVPPPKTSLVQRVRLRTSLAILMAHASWGAFLDCGQSVHLRWQVQLVDRRGRVIGRDVLAQEIYTD